MAQKRTTKKTTQKTTTMNTLHFLRMCSFFALVISAALYLLSGIANLLQIGFLVGLVGVFNLIAQLLLLVGIGFAAYDYTCGKPRVWRIVFWVALAVYVLGCVFGII